VQGHTRVNNAISINERNTVTGNSPPRARRIEGIVSN
jgi:hypothetical protein